VDRKEGDLESLEGQQQEPAGETAPEQAAQMIEAEEKDGEMSENQARLLLESLRNEEERVRMIERSQQQRVIKDW
jgi:hypothetical protein